MLYEMITPGLLILQDLTSTVLTGTGRELFVKFTANGNGVNGAGFMFAFESVAGSGVRKFLKVSVI